MGLHGSSTTALIFQDVKVPAENVLSEVGKGHKVAFNVLELRALQAGRDVRRRRASARSPKARSYAATRRQFGQPIAIVRRDQAQDRRDGRPHLRDREPALPHRRPGRRADRRHAARGQRRIRGARRLRGVRRRSVDREGRRQRGAGLRARREHPDPRRQRLRAATTRPSATSATRASTASSKGTERDQPAADSRHADPPRASRATSPLIPAAKALQDELLGPPSMPPLATRRRARRRAPRDRVVQEDRADGARRRDADLRHRSSPTSRKC